MRISENGIALIKRFEGCELAAYRDIAGVWTIGYGHTGDRAVEGATLSQAEADLLLRTDLFPREQTVGQSVKAELNQNMFDALVSLVFNIGRAAFLGSTCLDRLNRTVPDYIGAAEALTWFNKATVNGVLREVQGLTRRRAAEKELFLTPMREIAAKKNTAKLTPDREAKPGPRLRCKTFDRSQLRRSS